MGSTGTSNSSKVIFSTDDERLNYYGYRDMQKQDMREAITSVKDAINEIGKNRWNDTDVEVLYEELANWYPRSMEADDAEKVVTVNYKDGYITTVDINLWENRDGKIEAKLTPGSYSFDEFSGQELEDMGIYQEDIERARASTGRRWR